MPLFESVLVLLAIAGILLSAARKLKVPYPSMLRSRQPVWRGAQRGGHRCQRTRQASLPDLTHGNERRVYGESVYASQKNLIASKAPHAKDFTGTRVRNRLGEVDEVTRSNNRNKSRIRSRVEHVFCVVKRLWGLQRGALSRTGEERCAVVYRIEVGQYIPGPSVVDGTGSSVRRKEGPKGPRIWARGHGF